MKKTTLSTTPATALSITLAAALFAAVLAVGCTSERPRSTVRVDPPAPTSESVGASRRATAHDILRAAQTGEVPDWFSAEERKAVEKLK